MSIDAFTGVVGNVLHSALDGLAARQRAVADNVANIQTPGYLAKRVDFESSLQSALSSGDLASGGDTPVSTTESTDPARLDGNNVNLDQETLLDTESSLRYSLTLRAVDDRFALVRTALRGA